MQMAFIVIGGYVVATLSVRDPRDLKPQCLQFSLHNGRTLLHWPPMRFLATVAKSVLATTGVLTQFPHYSVIASTLTQAKNGAGLTVSDQISHVFVGVSSQHLLYPLLIGTFSA
jgi:short subunit fatty acids transporter